jgi:hypothetical protein
MKNFICYFKFISEIKANKYCLLIMILLIYLLIFFLLFQNLQFKYFWLKF